MKALQLVAPRTLEVATMPDPPEPGRGEVLVRIRSCGICGSDMHYYLEDACAGTKAVYPSVLGHEPAGSIEQIGPGVEDLASGTPVAVEPALTCGQCEPCRIGRPNLCLNSQFLGGAQGPGLLREYAVVPAHNVVPLPEEMSFSEATVIEPLAVLVHSVELAGLQMGETVLVMGAGPIGVLGVATAKIAGASRIIAADRIENRLAAAREAGADAAVNVDCESVRDAVMDLTHGLGVHVAIDAAGKPDSINTSLHCLRFGGRLMIIGIPSQQFVGVDLWRAMHQEISIHVQKRSNANDHEALDMLVRGQIDTGRFITHHVPLQEGVKAFEAVANYSDGVLKAVVEL